MSTGSWVRDARMTAGKTQRQIADAAGVTSKYISNVEAGIAPLTNPTTIRVFAAELGVPDLALFAAAHRIPDDIEAWLTDGNTAHLAAVRALMTADEDA